MMGDGLLLGCGLDPLSPKDTSDGKESGVELREGCADGICSEDCGEADRLRTFGGKKISGEGGIGESPLQCGQLRPVGAW